MGEALRKGQRLLSDHGIARSDIDCLALLSHATGRDKGWLLAHPETELFPAAQARWEQMLERRCCREPLAYILQTREFYGIQLRVDHRVLVPRPETELLLEIALGILGPTKGERRSPLVADVGTGSGAIAIAVALHCPWVRLIATDLSEESLSLARENLASHGLARSVHLVTADLLEGLRGPFDLVLANLPYIAAKEIPGLMPEVSKFEPRVALDGGPTGTELTARLLSQLPGHLSESGAALVEVGEGQSDRVRELAAQAFPGAEVLQHLDYSGIPRVVEIRGTRVERQESRVAARSPESGMKGSSFDLG